MSSVSEQLVAGRNGREEEERNREERFRGIEKNVGKERRMRELKKRKLDEKIEKIEQKEEERMEIIRSIEERMLNMEGEVRKERMEVARMADSL